MFETILTMVLALVLGSVHSAAHITPKEWTLIDSVQSALTALQSKKPVA